MQFADVQFLGYLSGPQLQLLYQQKWTTEAHLERYFVLMAELAAARHL